MATRAVHPRGDEEGILGYPGYMWAEAYIKRWYLTTDGNVYIEYNAVTTRFEFWDLNVNSGNPVFDYGMQDFHLIYDGTYYAILFGAEDDPTSNDARGIRYSAGDIEYNDAGAWTDIGTGGGATQLSELSDVGVTTPTDKNVLVADGDSWESRALVEADISDLDHTDVNAVHLTDSKVIEISFDPGAWYDSDTQVFIMEIGAEAPDGITVEKWSVSCNVDPDVEMNMDLKRADAWIGLANSAVMDVLDTTNGVSSETTEGNINGGAVVTTGKVIYLEFGADPEGTCVQLHVKITYRLGD